MLNYQTICHREHRGHREKYMNARTSSMSTDRHLYIADVMSWTGFVGCSVPSVAIIA
jgi:hypothetical protein